MDFGKKKTGEKERNVNEKEHEHVRDDAYLWLFVPFHRVVRYVFVVLMPIMTARWSMQIALCYSFSGNYDHKVHLVEYISMPKYSIS